MIVIDVWPRGGVRKTVIADGANFFLSSKHRFVVCLRHAVVSAQLIGAIPRAQFGALLG